jgi:EAL domain-containing protein (putative c-di-GMP-specific phosphodiesterase class I)
LRAAEQEVPALAKPQTASAVDIDLTNGNRRRGSTDDLINRLIGLAGEPPTGDLLDSMRAAARAIVDELDRAERVKERRAEAVRIGRLMRQQAVAMVFQPIVELSTGRPVGFEALARFRRRASPGRWFAEAARVGLGTALELLAIRLALEDIAQVPPDSFLAVNLSPPSLASPGLTAILEKVDGHRVVFELTEHAGVESYGALDRTLQPYRNRGVRLAIDDVGAGFASLKHVISLSPDMLKLDISLTTRIDTDRVRRALVASLVTFADQVGTTLTAEGIATGREFDVLLDLGVRFGQGYFLGRPKPLSMLGQPGI